MRVAARLAGLTAVTAVLAACSSSATAPSGGSGGRSQTITASSTTSGGAYGSGGNYFFSPNPDTVTAGAAVTFTIGSVAHDVHFTAIPAGAMEVDSIPLGANQSVMRTLTTPGTYTIHCTKHNFSATVVVQ